VNGVGTLDDDAAVGSIHRLDVGLVVVGLDLMHARDRKLAHIDGPVCVVGHGGDVLVEVAQAGGKVRLELLLACARNCALRSLAALLVVVSAQAAKHRNSNSDGFGSSEGGLNEG
jgi:hypothetical protein